MKIVLILNAGSSSLKFKAFSNKDQNLEEILSGQFSRLNTDSPAFVLKDALGKKITEETFKNHLESEYMLTYLIDQLKSVNSELEILGVAHRVVHGADTYIAPTVVTEKIVSDLKDLIYLSPIHLPHNIAPMDVFLKKFPNIPQVACFDTAFHSTIPDINKYYAIPRKFTEEKKIKRYGFHGLSYEYLIGALNEIKPELSNKNVIIAHLGAGASITGLKNQKSFATTMGMTPLDGLPMATRCGAIDPGIILYFIKEGYSYKELENMLYFQSGLLGLSENTGDFRDLSASDEVKSKEAVEFFVNAVAKYILELSSSLEGFDALIFSGGIGENDYKFRSKVLNKLKWLGLEIDETANKDHKTEISKADSKIKAFMIRTEEELIIARHAVKLINKN